jgi:hypothetical protein
MDRRLFLRSLGLSACALGAGGLLTGCGETAGVPAGEPTWSLVPGGYPELLVGSGRRLAFGLVTRDNVRVDESGVEVFTREVGGEVLDGPFEARFHPDAGGGLGIYLTAVDVPHAGVIEIAAVSGDAFGTAAVQVVEPSASAVPVPGSQAIVTATPTEQAPLGFSHLCTANPPCPMHAESLDAVLAAGRPVVLMFATPAYCQTAVCAPGVDTLAGVRDSRDWGDVAFVHCEIFTDEGVTVGEPVQDWGLPSEPWLFTIDREGTIVARVDGPMIDEELTSLVEAIA